MQLQHSYSSVKQFDNCSRQFYEMRILKKYKSKDTDATLYGTAVHKAFEEFIRDSIPLPETFECYRKYVEPISNIKGDIRCEEKLGIKRDFSPCGFFDDDVWFRGIPDFLALNYDTGVARVADWKTGKSSRYADPDQLELMAAMVMQHHPQINTVKGALVFVVANSVVKAEFTRSQLPEILSRWGGKATMIEKVMEKGVVSARPSGLCRFCPVSSCPHYKE